MFFYIYTYVYNYCWFTFTFICIAICIDLYPHLYLYAAAHQTGLGIWIMRCNIAWKYTYVYVERPKAKMVVGDMINQILDRPMCTRDVYGGDKSWFGTRRDSYEPRSNFFNIYMTYYLVSFVLHVLFYQRCPGQNHYWITPDIPYAIYYGFIYAKSCDPHLHTAKNDRSDIKP